MWWTSVVRDVCTWIVSQFLVELIETNVNINRSIDKVVKSIDPGASAHQFLLNLRLEPLTEHGHQRSVVPTSAGSMLLEFCSVISS